MKKFIILAAAAIVTAAASCSQYKYETVKGDPLGTKMYTLDNGLKVYMSVNKETPRIQTYIAVRRKERPVGDDRPGTLLRAPDVQRNPELRHIGLYCREAYAG